MLHVWRARLRRGEEDDLESRTCRCSRQVEFDGRRLLSDLSQSMFSLSNMQTQSDWIDAERRRR